MTCTIGRRDTLDTDIQKTPVPGRIESILSIAASIATIEHRIIRSPGFPVNALVIVVNIM
jgi:hypothetical protein